MLYPSLVGIVGICASKLLQLQHFILVFVIYESQRNERVMLQFQATQILAYAFNTILTELCFNPMDPTGSSTHLSTAYMLFPLITQTNAIDPISHSVVVFI